LRLKLAEKLPIDKELFEKVEAVIIGQCEKIVFSSKIL
jgi:hypothetical protein